MGEEQGGETMTIIQAHYHQALLTSPLEAYSHLIFKH